MFPRGRHRSPTPRETIRQECEASAYRGRPPAANYSQWLTYQTSKRNSPCYEPILIQSLTFRVEQTKDLGVQVMASTGSGKAELFMDEHGILQLKWAHHAIIRSGDAETAMHMVNELCGKTERPLLVDMTTTSAVSRGARAIFARTCQASHVALLGASPVDKVIATFVLAMNKTPRPKRFFTSRAEAMAWLTTSTA